MVTKAVAFENAADMAIVMPMMLCLSRRTVIIDIGRQVMTKVWVGRLQIKIDSSDKCIFTAFQPDITLTNVTLLAD